MDTDRRVQRHTIKALQGTRELDPRLSSTTAEELAWLRTRTRSSNPAQTKNMGNHYFFIDSIYPYGLWTCRPFPSLTTVVAHVYHSFPMHYFVQGQFRISMKEPSEKPRRCCMRPAHGKTNRCQTP